MENKKQLIIIPPMSEAVKKLNEVLEGISADENMEITLIDDMKELAQFLGATGQCLILVSNAKKCATFLQENRFVLAKHHCKTILFTPKEIPIKTLTKFTKIGLTESILESLPPKTFLYKVKLLLRSIKTAKPQDEGDKIVKSLESSKVQQEAMEIVDKEKVQDEENVIDMDMKRKTHEAGDTIDYDSQLKGKVKPQEESIDTHWKSDRKQDASNQDEEAEENMDVSSKPDDIDMYYRGKRKKVEDQTSEEDDLSGFKKLDLPEEEEKEKKKSSFADIIDEGSIKQTRLDIQEADNNEDKKNPLIDLELIPSLEKKKHAEAAEEEESYFRKKNNKSLDKEKELDDLMMESEIEDLGGHLKGKVSTSKAEEDMPEIEADMDYDNSDLQNERTSDIDLDLIATKKKKRKNDIEGTEEEETYEGEVDHIDNNMSGDGGTPDKIRSFLSGESDYREAPLGNDNEIQMLSKKAKLAAVEEEDAELINLDLIAAAKKEKNKEEKAENEEEAELKKEKVDLDLLPKDPKSREKADTGADEEDMYGKKLAQVAKEEKEKKERETGDKTEEKNLGMRTGDGENSDDKKNKNNPHSGQVEKIDAFYRGGEAKKKDQNWDNLTDKSATLDLLAAKERKASGSVGNQEKVDLGEVTIDYRKLKEEFDLMSSGGSVGGAASNGVYSDTKLKNDDDEGSFKVVEIDPKSLDFSIAIVNAIYQKEIKPKQIFSMLATELINNYHCYPVFYTYKLSDKKFTEAFNSYIEISNDTISAEKKDWWNEFKKDTSAFENFQSKSMTTWRCPEIVNNNEVWEDVELPSWAENELKTKHVELIFPYFDGIDRMGMAVVFFPDGITPTTVNGLLTVMELARSLFLDTIQRYQVQPIRQERDEASDEAIAAPLKKNVLSFFSGIFGKKKAG